MQGTVVTVNASYGCIYCNLFIHLISNMGTYATNTLQISTCACSKLDH